MCPSDRLRCRRRVRKVAAGLRPQSPAVGVRLMVRTVHLLRRRIPPSGHRATGDSTPTTEHPSPPTTDPKPTPPTSPPSPPPTTSKPPPPPPTTTPPPPAPPTGLTASASCSYVIAGPQIKVTWTDSKSRVYGYSVLRSSTGRDFSAITFVGASSSSYKDTKVQGLGITYWYEIEAHSASGSSETCAVSATTPLLCASPRSAPGAEAGSRVQHRERAGEDGYRSDVLLGIHFDDVYGFDSRM